MHAEKQVSRSFNIHHSSARLFRLRAPDHRCAIVGRSSSGHHTDHSRHTDVLSRCYSIHQGVTSNVQSHEAVQNQPLLEPSCEGWYGLLSCACPPLVPCSFPFPCYQANDELLRAAFCYIPYSICWASSTFRGSIRGRRYYWG